MNAQTKKMCAVLLICRNSTHMYTRAHTYTAHMHSETYTHVTCAHMHTQTYHTHTSPPRPHPFTARDVSESNGKILSPYTHMYTYTYINILISLHPHTYTPINPFPPFFYRSAGIVAIQHQVHVTMHHHLYTHVHIHIHTHKYTPTSLLLTPPLSTVPQDVSQSNTKFMSAPASGPMEYDLAKIQQFV